MSASKKLLRKEIKTVFSSPHGLNPQLLSPLLSFSNQRAESEEHIKGPKTDEAKLHNITIIHATLSLNKSLFMWLCLQRFKRLVYVFHYFLGKLCGVLIKCIDTYWYWFTRNCRWPPNLVHILQAPIAVTLGSCPGEGNVGDFQNKINWGFFQTFHIPQNKT